MKWVPYDKTPEGIRKAAERFEEVMVLIRKAQAADDGLAFIEALKRMPESRLNADEQLELRREWILARVDRREPPTFGPPMIDVPDTRQINPMRHDGQIHNFDALPYPGHRRYTLNMWLVRNNSRLR